MEEGKFELNLPENKSMSVWKTEEGEKQRLGILL